MLRLTASALALAAFTGAGCGRDEVGLPAACQAGSEQIAAALHAAPQRVALRDGTRLSSCVGLASQDGELQTVGATFTRVADDLARQMPARDAAAVQLGYLIGATRRGASETNGIHLELVRRLDQTVGLDGAPPHRRAAFQRGLAAGSRRG